MDGIVIRIDEPVTPQRLFVWIIVPEKCVWNNGFPDSSLYILPVLNSLGAFDNHLFPLGGFIYNAADIAVAAVFRLYPFPVFTLMHNDLIPCFGGLCCL